ncbi:MAG: CHAT domain-containing protein [Symploca sp. SIO3E6]|nr:CHAT domain-containing protein [Caldora sp. SIO3E6]
MTDYPWELLHNKYGFLAKQGVTFSRYIAYPSPRPNLPPVEQLNVLLISSGAGDERMNMKPLPAVEREAIAKGLKQAQEQGKVKLEILKSPTLDALRQRLLEFQTKVVPQVLHFDGHGFIGKRCNEIGCRKAYRHDETQCECGKPLGEVQGYLVFEDSNGKADYVSATELGDLLGNARRREQPNSEPGMALIVLSACSSGMSCKSESVFNGVAQNLIGAGIPSVVAMTYPIIVPAASTFAEWFYRSIGEKESLAIALRRGQSAMGIEGNQWYRPVLYLRWEDNEGGQLFKNSALESDIASPNLSNNPIEPSPQNQLSSPVLMLDNNQMQTSLCEALLHAYKNERELERTLKTQLNWDLNDIDTAQSYRGIVKDSIEQREGRGELRQLVIGASKGNPGNPSLRKFVQDFLPNLLIDIDDILEPRLVTSLINYLKYFQNFAVIKDCCLLTIPDLSVHRLQEVGDIENKELAPAVKWLIILGLLLKEYRRQPDGTPYIINFVTCLQKKVNQQEIQQQLAHWLGQVEPLGQYSTVYKEIVAPVLTLNDVQKRRLREALMSAFLTEPDLEMMLEDELGIPLNTIAGGSNYKQIVNTAVKWFDSQGQSQDLIQAARRANPGNPKLKAFALEIGLGDD